MYWASFSRLQISPRAHPVAGDRRARVPQQEVQRHGQDQQGGDHGAVHELHQVDEPTGEAQDRLQVDVEDGVCQPEQPLERPEAEDDRARGEEQEEGKQAPAEDRRHLLVEVVRQRPERDVLVRIHGLHVVEPPGLRALGAPPGRGDDAARDEVPEREAVAVAEVGEAIEGVVLVAVLDPDRVARDRPGDVHHGLEADVVSRELGPVRRHAGQVVVVVAGQQRDRHPLAGLAELAEQRGTHGGDPLQLRRTLAIGQLPESEGIAHDDELGGLWPRGDLRQERDQLGSKSQRASPPSPPMCRSLMR